MGPSFLLSRGRTLSSQQSSINFHLPSLSTQTSLGLSFSTIIAFKSIIIYTSSSITTSRSFLLLTSQLAICTALAPTFTLKFHWSNNSTRFLQNNVHRLLYSSQRTSRVPCPPAQMASEQLHTKSLPVDRHLRQGHR